MDAAPTSCSPPKPRRRRLSAIVVPIRKREKGFVCKARDVIDRMASDFNSLDLEPVGDGSRRIHKLFVDCTLPHIYGARWIGNRRAALQLRGSILHKPVLMCTVDYLLDAEEALARTLACYVVHVHLAELLVVGATRRALRRLSWRVAELAEEITQGRHGAPTVMYGKRDMRVTLMGPGLSARGWVRFSHTGDVDYSQESPPICVYYGVTLSKLTDQTFASSRPLDSQVWVGTCDMSSEHFARVDYDAVAFENIPMRSGEKKKKKKKLSCCFVR